MWDYAHTREILRFAQNDELFERTSRTSLVVNLLPGEESMPIKFQSGFAKFVKTFVGIVAAALVLWAMWTWRAEILVVGMFSILSVLRTMVNMALIVGAAFVIGWFVPRLIAKYVLEGVSPPRAPWRIWKYAMVVSAVAGLLLVPMNMSVHNRISRAVEPLAEQFAREAHCEYDACYVPDETLRQRDMMVSAYGGVRIGGWYVTGDWRDDGGVDTSRVLYVWNAPFLVF